MRVLKSAVLYTALLVGANAAIADPAALEALRTGEMKRLAVHSEPKAVSEASFLAEDGSEMTLADFAGEVVLLNFWATWCAPCREEMPALAALQEEFGEDGFRVVTLATGRNAPGAVDRFFDEIGVTNLPKHRDPKQAVAREMAVAGLPISVLIDAEGHEVARLIGDADWASDEAKAVVSAMLAGAEG